jgi:putative ABC transport system permease protein
MVVFDPPDETLQKVESPSPAFSIGKRPITRISIAGVRAHPGRFASLTFAVFIGVLFIAATLTITDTVRAGFGSLFSNAYRGVSVVVREKSDVVRQNQTFRGRIDAGLTEIARAAPGVVAAQPRISGYAYVVSAQGKAPENVTSDTAGSPIAENWVDDASLNPYTLVEGAKPTKPGEVVIDRGTANSSLIAVGETVSVISKDGATPGRVVGIVRFGSVDSPGAVPVVLFPLNDAQRLLGEPGRTDAVLVAGREGLSDQALASSLQKLLPSGIEAVTGKTVTKESESQVANGLRFITAFLLIFAVLSLIVGAFIIANTFAISISQRTRELALLRAIGASRSQIGRMMLSEALAMSIVGSLTGLLGGIALAAGLQSILRATGVDLPPSPVVVRPATVAWSLGIGLLVTLGAAATPAWRAARISPVAAMRESEFEPPALRKRTLLGLVVSIIGALIMLSGANLPSLPRTGQGAALLLVGSILLAPALGTLLRVLIDPTRKLFGTTSGLAVRNTTRNPRRTASTALALSLGSAVACFAVILNASLQASLSTAVGGGLRGDLVVRSGSFGNGGLPASLATSIADLPNVEAASGLRYGFATVEGPKRKAKRPSAVSRSGGRPIASFNPVSADRLLDFGREQGKFSDLSSRSEGQPSNIALSRRELDDHGWKVGDTIKLTFPGKDPAPFRISTVYTQGIAFDFAIANQDYEKYVPDVFDFVVYVAAKPGVSIDNLRADIATLTTAYPTAKVEDPKQYVKRLTGSLDQLLSLILGLLVLVVVVAVLGIAITLSLSVVERVREIGLLRTLGMQRSQIRSMLRSEAILISLFAVSIGVVLGTAVSRSLLKALKDEGLSRFVFPPLGVASLALLAAVAGLIASLAPARRAARLPMLSALSGLHEAPSTQSGPPVTEKRFKRSVRVGIAGALVAMVGGFALGRATAPQASKVMRAENGKQISAGVGVAGVADSQITTTVVTTIAPKLPGALSTVDGLVGGSGPDALEVSNLPYAVPSDSGIPKPGRLRLATPISAPTGLKAWRVLYDSSIRDGQTTIVSGLVFAPDRPAPSQGWPVVSFAHPTTGLADRCAPSRNVGVLENTVATLVGQLNMVAVASDYPGLGTEGPHPFLDGVSSGRAVLDIATAAASIDGLPLSNATILWGHSQGGHAALWAGSQAPTYAPNLEIRGVLAGAPPSQLRTLVDGLEKTPDRGYASLIAKGLQSVNPSLQLTDVLSPRGIELTKSLEDKCSGEVNESAQRDTVRAVAPLPTAWLNTLDANEPGRVKMTAPILIIHGEADELVPVGSSKALQDQLIALGSTVERKVYPGAGHADVVLTSLTDSIAWISKQAATPAAARTDLGVPPSSKATITTGSGEPATVSTSSPEVPKPTAAGKVIEATAGVTQQWPGARGLLKAALDRGKNKPLVIAHAGGDLEAPHATMYSFKRAVALGADVLELDVRLAKDGVLIVQHDPLLDRTASENGPAVERTAAQLAKLDNAYWFTGGCWDCRTSAKTPPFRGVRTGQQKPPQGYSAEDFGISSLQEVMRQFPDQVIDIEIKTDGPDGGTEVATALAKLLNADPKPDRFLVVSFDDTALVTFRKSAPTIGTSPGINEIIRYVLAGLPLETTPVLQIPPEAQGLKLLTPKLQARAKAEGIALWVWPVDPAFDTKADYRKILEFEPNGIIAGRPADLIDVLRKR